MDPDALTRAVWTIDANGFPADGSIEDQARFLLRYAILAPSSHNSQPWTFDSHGDTVDVHAAEDRWLRVADEDRRELALSLGCAIETLAIAAAHFGLGYRIDYPADAPPAAVVTLDPDGEPPSTPQSGLFEAITARSTNQHPFDERPLPDGLLERFDAILQDTDVALDLIEDPDIRGSIAELQAEADRKQMQNPDYRKELGYWIGTGALGSSWLAARIGRLVVSHLDLGDREAARNSRRIRSAPVIGVLLTERAEFPARIEAGRAFQRLSLLATAEGVAVHPMSQILERTDTSRDLQTLRGYTERHAQHLFRLGYATESPDQTPRWPLEQFLVDES